MKTEIIQSHAMQTQNGVESWLARDLQRLPGYEQWRNFKAVIDKAKTACETAKHSVSNRFAAVVKTIKIPKGLE